jgi:hypothetical protein
MMQQISADFSEIQLAVMAIKRTSDFTPQAMAQYLRRTSGSAAYCFAQAMHEGSAWANETWGDYWANVMRLV